MLERSKAAHLTLFSLLGYHYALSAAGELIGRGILGKFFRRFHDASVSQARSGAAKHFREFATMVRPVEGEGIESLRGTIEDQVVAVCEGSSGLRFGIIVFVRTGATVQAVLVPAFDNVEAVPTYLEFMKNPNEQLSVRHGTYDRSLGRWELEKVTRPIRWPKSDDTFDL